MSLGAEAMVNDPFRVKCLFYPFSQAFGLIVLHNLATD